MKLLRENRGMSRGEAILFGLKSRAKSMGMWRSLGKTSAILGADAFRAVVLTALRIFVLYPLNLVQTLKNALFRRKAMHKSYKIINHFT
jgi:hypothetical protein